jgi:hypothetical protein
VFKFIPHNKAWELLVGRNVKFAKDFIRFYSEAILTTSTSDYDLELKILISSGLDTLGIFI